MISDQLFSFRSDRRFSILGYARGHGQLVLESLRDDHPARLEISFSDVRGMDIRPLFDGIHIEEVTPDYLDRWPSRPAEQIERHGEDIFHRAFAFHGAGWDGYVVAGNIWVQDIAEPLSAPNSYAAGLIFHADILSNRA